MQTKHPIITHAYHFLCEAIILFLLTVPVMHFHYHGAGYWYYSGIIMGICFLFSILARFKSTYLPFVLTAPLILLIFLFEFSLGLSVFFSVMLTWRYLAIRGEMFINREKHYMVLTLFLTIFIVIVFKDIQVITLLFFQTVILFIGYLSSHLMVINKAEKKQFNPDILFYIVAMVTLGAIITFSLFDTIRYVVSYAWNGIGYVIIFFAKLAEMFINSIDSRDLPEIIESEAASLVEDPEQDGSIATGILTYVVTYIGITVFLIGVGIFALMRMFNGRLKENDENGAQEIYSYPTSDEINWKYNHFNLKNLKPYFSKPNHPVRKMVYQFERKARKNEKGRKSFETIEDWLKRIGMNSNIEVYQKVRYGDTDVSSVEVEQLKTELKEF